MSDVNITIRLQAEKATANAKKFQTSLSRTEKATKSLQVSLKSTSSAFKVFAGNIAAIGVASLVRGLANAARGVRDLGFASVQAASDAEETLNKFSVVFQDVGDEATKAAETLAQNFGLAGSKAQELLADTGDLLTGFGFTGEAALGLSTQVQELAVDLASFTNFSGGAEGASAALTKALLGERESVKSLGISIQEADVQRQVAINNANGLTFATERQAKAQATLQIALRQSQNAIGDFARSQGSLANLQRVLDARFQTFQETVGKELVPAFKAATIATIGFLDRLQQSGAVQEAVAKVTAAFPAVLRSVTTAINTSIEAYSALEQGINSVLAAGAAIVKGFVDIGITAVDTAIKVKSAFGGDTSGLEQLRKDLVGTAADLGSFGVAALQANSDLEDSTNRVTAAISRESEAFLVSYQKELAAAQERTTGVAESNDTLVADQVQTNQELADLQLQKDLAGEELRLSRLETEQGFFNSLIEAEQNKEQQALDIRRQATINTIKDKAALQKELLKLDTQQIQLTQKQEADANARRVADRKSTLNTLVGLTRSSNSTLFAIGKAAAIADATIQGIGAVQKALNAAPPPFNFALAAVVGAATAENVSRIASQKKPSFQDGGIVPGNSFSGDNVQANVNSGEVILNRQQQAETLFAIANGAGGAGGGQREIVVNTSVQVDGTEIARAVSREVADGAVLGEFE